MFIIFLYTIREVRNNKKRKEDKKMKRVKFEELVIGREYFVKCGIWQSVVTYVGMIPRGGSNVACPLFTFGPSIEEWQNNINIHSAKSNIKVYEIDIKKVSMTNFEIANWLNYKIDNAYSLRQGAVNRLSVTEDNDEYAKMLKFINYYTDIIDDCVKCFANNYDCFDEIYYKYTIVL